MRYVTITFRICDVHITSVNSSENTNITFSEVMKIVLRVFEV